MENHQKEAIAFSEKLNLFERPPEFQEKLEIGGNSIEPLKILQDFINVIDGVEIGPETNESELPEGKNFDIKIEIRKENRIRKGEFKKREPTKEEIDVALKEDLTIDPMNIWGRDGMVGDLINATEINLPVSTIKIKIGKNFSYTNLPELIRELQRLHNEFVINPEVYAAEKSYLREASDYVMQIAESMAASYFFFARKIEEMNSERNIPQYEEYAKTLNSLGKQFAPPDSSFFKTHEWFYKIEPNLEKRAKQIFSLEREKENFWSRIGERDYRIKSLNRIVANSIRKSLVYGFEEAIFERGEREVWRQSDMPEIFADNFSIKMWQKYDCFFSDNFPKEWGNIQDAQIVIEKAKENGDKNEISKVQTEIIKVFCNILYSDKFFFYNFKALNLDSIYKNKFVNCMGLSQILHLLCQKIFGEETLAVKTNEHLFSAFVLANGKMLSLDGEPKEIKLENRPGLQIINGKYYIVCMHAQMYRTGIWVWQHNYYIQQKKYSAAFVCCKKAIDLNKVDPDSYYNLGRTLYSNKQYEEAIAAYKKAIALNPDEHSFHYNLGNILCSNKQYEEAIAAYKKVIELKPDESYFYCNLGEALYSNKQYEEAIAICKKTIALKPDEPDFYYNLGNIFYSNKQYEEAIATYKKAIDLKPDDPIFYYNLGNIFYSNKQYEEAIATYKKAIALNPDDHRFHYNLGLALRKTKDFQMAEKSYFEAINLSKSKDVWYLFYIADFYDGGYFTKDCAPSSDFKKALEYYKKAFELNSSLELSIPQEEITNRIAELEGNLLHKI